MIQRSCGWLGNMPHQRKGTLLCMTSERQKDSAFGQHIATFQAVDGSAGRDAPALAGVMLKTTFSHQEIIFPCQNPP